VWFCLLARGWAQEPAPPPTKTGPEMIPEEVWASVNAVDPATAADLALPLKDGGTFRLSDQTGKRVLLAFWASWCAPCRRELPALSTWAKAHPEIVTLAVNVDRTEGDAAQFLDKVHFDLPVAFAPDAKELGRFGVASMPTMFLLDGRGQIAWRHSGFSEDKGFTELDQAVAKK
jgi:thiol-disulfide isomerase/thioredoxin